MYENRISTRQLRRMIFIETFGAGALSVPTLVCYRGQSGFWSLIFYGIFLAGTATFFISFSGKTGYGSDEGKMKIHSAILKGKRIANEKDSFETIEEQETNTNILKDKMNSKYADFADSLPQSVKIIYVVRFLINAAALFYFFGRTIQTVYLPEKSLLFILFPVAILLWYSLYTTLQKRARFLELIFPWVITMYFIAVILSFIGIEKAIQIEEAGKLWPGILSDNIFRSMEGGYLLLLCNSPIEFLLFLRPAAEKRNKKKKVIWGIITAAVGTFLCNGIFCFLAVRTLGPILTNQSEWPVIKMMQLIRMPGGFLERFDILPAVFWILCMIAVLSGYLYYSWRFYHSMINHCSCTSLRNINNDSERNSSHNMHLTLFAVIDILCMLLLSYLVEKHVFLWTTYLKYKAFVDFPLSLLLPVIVCIFRGKRGENPDDQEGKDKRRFRECLKNHSFNLYTLICGIFRPHSVGVASPAAFIFLATVFSLTGLTGCQRLTDVEEKNYILSMYVDYPSDEENVYEFWLARANLSEMEEQSDEIPCQITKIKARNLQELEEKYLETVPGKTEWNHIYTIFLGSGMAVNKEACNSLLKEWDREWQKSPNVLLALCPESPEKLYKIKKIPAGAAGQEASLLAEQNKEKYSEQICETPIDYLRARQQKVEKIALYRIIIENRRLKITRGVI